MLPRHITILKPKDGELLALKHLDGNTRSKVLPLFDVDRMPDPTKLPKYLQSSKAPVTTFIDRALDKVAPVWGGLPAMVDGYQWQADARTESGIHVIAHMITRLQTAGIPVIPVVGYDRWDNTEYRIAMRSIAIPKDGHYCLRLDKFARLILDFGVARWHGSHDRETRLVW
jgi:hypothetical protein